MTGRWNWTTGFVTGLLTAILIDLLIQSHMLQKETQELTAATARLEQRTKAMNERFKD